MPIRLDLFVKLNYQSSTICLFIYYGVVLTVHTAITTTTTTTATTTTTTEL